MKSILSLATLLFFIPLFTAHANDPDRRVSATGAAFERDSRFPELGDAFRDPRGLVWGEILNLKEGDEKELVPGDGPVSSPNQLSAERHCASLGARLPTLAEFQHLYDDFGGRTYDGYFPWTAEDSRVPMLPKFVGYMFWSSTRDTEGRRAAAFSGAFGAIGWRSLGNMYIQARCVRDGAGGN